MRIASFLALILLLVPSALGASESDFECTSITKTLIGSLWTATYANCTTQPQLNVTTIINTTNITTQNITFRNVTFDETSVFQNLSTYFGQIIFLNTTNSKLVERNLQLETEIYMLSQARARFDRYDEMRNSTINNITANNTALQFQFHNSERLRQYYVIGWIATAGGITLYFKRFASKRTIPFEPSPAQEELYNSEMLEKEVQRTRDENQLNKRKKRRGK